MLIKGSRLALGSPLTLMEMDLLAQFSTSCDVRVLSDQNQNNDQQ